MLSTVEDCAADVGCAEVGTDYLKIRLGQLTDEDAAGLIIDMELVGAVAQSDGFVKIRPGREKPELDAAAKELFEEFWSRYPRQEAKLRCGKAWLAMTPEARRLAVEGVKVFALMWTGRPSSDLRFCPLPINWLAEKRYEDMKVEKKEDPTIKAGEKWLQKNS